MTKLQALFTELDFLVQSLLDAGWKTRSGCPVPQQR